MTAVAGQALWSHVASSPAGAHRVPVDDGISLALRCRRDGRGRVDAPRLVLIGPVDRVRIYDPPPGERIEAIRIKPEWSRLVLSAVAREHTDALDDYRSVAPSLARPLFDRLVRTRSTDDALSVLAGFVRGRLGSPPTPSPAPSSWLSSALDDLRRRRQPLSVLAERHGVSERHLRRACLQATGDSPSRIARIARVHALIRTADRQSAPQWADLALLHGFSDQSHMVREVSRYTGISPVRLHRERRAEPAPPAPASDSRS